MDADAQRDRAHTWQVLAEVEKPPGRKEGCHGLSKDPRR